MTKLKLTKKRVFAAVAVAGLMLLAAGLGVFIRWLQQNDIFAREASKPTAVQERATTSQDLAVNGKYDEAHKKLQDALDSPYLSADEKYTLTLQQGVTYENQKKYEDSLKKYQEAEAIKPTKDVAESIARVAENMKNKDLAISSYKAAITRIAKDSPLAEADKDRYEDLIRSLGGQP